ncbi:hypothetical protein [Asticcacaulis machinosus]|uniref:Uncharacterized protein n=1 Tax=Asticcacaulis machinosus TaxID=2984211 RepID=A0ABT5HJC3_9CAUL|nr:hypothetical protein [Asticcacaulis machinosus]MDC7676342.1 hypothetical protein [Asticcacaulis machinosus]
MDSSHKYRWLLVFGVAVSAVMLICAVYIKSFPILPFILLNWFILLAFGHSFRRASGEARKCLGLSMLCFLAVFTASGLAALMLNPRLI